MMKLLAILTTVVLAFLLALPTAGCQEKDKRKVLDVQVQTGKTKVTVEGTKKADESGKRFNVEVEHHPGHEHESNDRGK